MLFAKLVVKYVAIVILKPLNSEPTKTVYLFYLPPAHSCISPTIQSHPWLYHLLAPSPSVWSWPIAVSHVVKGLVTAQSDSLLQLLSPQLTGEQIEHKGTQTDTTGGNHRTAEVQNILNGRTGTCWGLSSMTGWRPSVFVYVSVLCVCICCSFAFSVLMQVIICIFVCVSVCVSFSQISQRTVWARYRRELMELQMMGRWKTDNDSSHLKWNWCHVFSL